MLPAQYENTLSIGKMMRILWITVGVLLGIHVILSVIHYQMHELPWPVRQIFDVDEEDSFPTWYSATALFLTSVILWINARAHRQSNHPLRLQWYGLAAGFLFLSIDEIAGMHETLTGAIEMSWAIPGGIVALIVGVAYLSFLAKLPRSTAGWFVIGGAVYVGGAVGVELFTEPYLANDELDTLAYYLWNALEEGMEMIGVLIFLRALLHSMKGHAPSLPLTFTLTD